MNYMRLLIICLTACMLCNVHAQIEVSGWDDDVPEYPEPDATTKLQWLREYMLLIEVLPAGEFALGNPALIKKLASSEPAQRIAALRAIGGLGDPAAIPFLLPVIRNGDRSAQVWAGSAIEEIISRCESRRRSSLIAGEDYISPPADGELDLKPMRWIVFEMLTSGEPNLQAYGVTMAGYLDLDELRPIVEALRASRHPAVTNKIDRFLGIMDRSDR